MLYPVTCYTLLLLFFVLPCFKCSELFLSAAQNGFTQEGDATYNTIKHSLINCFNLVYLLKQMVGNTERESRADETGERRV